jgi:hypothetical protein
MRLIEDALGRTDLSGQWNRAHLVRLGNEVLARIQEGSVVISFTSVKERCAGS